MPPIHVGSIGFRSDKGHCEEMPVGCYQQTASFKYAGGNPDVVRGDGRAGGFQERVDPSVEFPCLAHDGQYGDLFHLQKRGKGFARGPLALCVTLRSSVDLAAYDSGNENLLDVLQHPCNRLVAIQERDDRV